MEQTAIEGSGTPGGGSSPDAAAPSVVAMINRVNRRLDDLLHRLPGESSAQEELLELAGLTVAAAERSRDIALACILLNQGAADYAIRHCVDTSIVSALFARSLEKSPGEILTIAAAALTMNVGMLQQQSRLQSRQDSLSNTDREYIRAHPQRGADLLRQAGVDDEDWLSCVLLHHENEDGSGYPSGMTGDEIPLSAKIISLADRYCARISSRNYRKSLLPDAALSEILIGDNASIDPMLTSCFIREFGIFPTGVFVRLANGEIGVVSGHEAASAVPVVHVLAGADGLPLSAPARRATAGPQYAVRNMLSGEQAGIRVDMVSIWGDGARP